jgi:predicted GNAT superfamily acetyltransferase
VISWTFDPLLRRNAWFNLGKIGAIGIAYTPDLYGKLGGDPSDRLEVRWDLRVQATGEKSAQAAERLLPTALVALEAGSSDEPRDRRRAVDGEAIVACRIPADIAGIRLKNPELASAWRYALRASLGGALETGYRLVGISRDGWYVLKNPTQQRHTFPRCGG